MKISLITVCFNSEKTIKDTFDSVLSQTYSDYEYIVIDGKSTDSTLSIIKEYEQKFNGKMKYVSEKDSGLYDAMNKGINLSTGDLIGILNSDDKLAHENVFKTISYNIKENNGIYSNLLMMDYNFSKPYRYFKSGKVSKKCGWHMPHPTLYLSREVFEKYGRYNTSYRICADYDFMLRIIENNVKLAFVDDVFVLMRSGGVSTDGLKGYYKNFCESLSVLRKHKIWFAFFVNCIRVFKTMILQRIIPVSINIGETLHE